MAQVSDSPTKVKKDKKNETPEEKAARKAAKKAAKEEKAAAKAAKKAAKAAKKEAKAAKKSKKRKRDETDEDTIGARVHKEHTKKQKTTASVENTTPDVDMTAAMKQVTAEGGNPLISSKRVPDVIVQTLAKDGITEMFPIQAQTFDPIFDGKDILGRAHTGSGKTLGFSLPVISKLMTVDGDKRKRFGRAPRVVCLAPTRELAMQVAKVFQQLCGTRLDSICIYGGSAYGPQIRTIQRGVDVVIGTCGRVKDMIEKEILKLCDVEFLILDEADEMLNIGFKEDVELVLKSMENACPVRKHQVLLFSATTPGWIRKLSDTYLRADARVNVDLVGTDVRQASSSVEHMVIFCHWQERPAVLQDILQVHAGPKSRVIIFCETKKECNELAMSPHIKTECQVLHGDISQQQREITTQGFRNGTFHVLIATDVAARGLDIKDVALVVHAEPPSSSETYIHRSGRTGRAGTTGKSILFYTHRQEGDMRHLESKVGVSFKRVGAPQTSHLVASSSEHAKQTLAKIKTTMSRHFVKCAKELLEDQDAEQVLAKALAAISGVEHGAARSLMSCSPGFVTIQASAGKSVSKGYFWGAMRRLIGEQECQNVRGMTQTVDGTGVVFDCPEHLADAFAEDEGPMFSVCEELPELYVDPNTKFKRQPKTWHGKGGRFGGGRGGRGRGGRGRGRGRGFGRGRR